MATDSVIEIGGDLLFLSQDGLRPVSGTDKIGDVNLETVSKDIQSIFTDIVFDIDLEGLNAVVFVKRHSSVTSLLLQTHRVLLVALDRHLTDYSLSIVRC
jgi:hypothetical protein